MATKESANKAEEKKIAGDASALFGDDSGPDLFSSVVQQPLANNASPAQDASSFFDQQPPQASTTPSSFFDNQHQHQQQPETLTQAYDPNQQQQQQQQQEQQWETFDINKHYYYDEYNQLHFYDPNTNQEVDIRQYGYDPQQFQYDPNQQYDANQQYAEYYNQQGYYDQNNYAPSSQVEPQQVHQQSDLTQQQYNDMYQNYNPVAAAVPATDAITGLQQQYDPNQQQLDQYVPQNQYDPQQNQYDSQQYQYQQQDQQYQQQTIPPPPPPAAAATIQETEQQQPDLSTFYQHQPDQQLTFDYSQQQQPEEQLAFDYSQQQQQQPEEQLTFDYSQQQQQQPEEQAQFDYSHQQEGPKTHLQPVIEHTDTPVSYQSGMNDTSTPIFELEDAAEKTNIELNDLDDLVLGNEGTKEFITHASTEVMDQQVVTLTAENLVNEAEPVVETGVISKEVESVAVVPQSNDESASIVEQSVATLTSSYEPAAVNNYEPPTMNSYEPVAVTSYEPTAVNGYEPTPVNSYEPTAYEPTAVTGYEPTTATTTTYEPTSTYDPNASYDFNAAYDPNTTHDPNGVYDPNTSYDFNAAYDVNATYDPNASYQPVEVTASYEPTTAYEPSKGHEHINGFEPTTGYEPINYQSYEQGNEVTMMGYEPTQDYQQQGYEPFNGGLEATTEQEETVNFATGNYTNEAVMPPPPKGGLYQDQKRANSIAVTSTPFTLQQETPIERSATVPPPATERIASPRPQLVSCPDPECEGENKPKAKFCCECGRPLAGISRSTTPAANLSAMMPNNFSFTPEIQNLRTPLDDKKDGALASLQEFNQLNLLNESVDIEEKKKNASGFIKGKEGLLYKLVNLMLTEQGQLGDGGALDQAILGLLKPASEDITSVLEKLDKVTLEEEEKKDEEDDEEAKEAMDVDKQAVLPKEVKSVLNDIEHYLIVGNREGAIEKAIENNMWDHAMVIAHSNGQFPTLVSRFIQYNLFTTLSKDALTVEITSDKRALRMLYAVFSGAGSEAVSELVRNTSEDVLTSVEVNQEALDHWQQALSLVLANRSENDQQAISALGDLLKENDLDSAHLCYLLSPDVSIEQQERLSVIGQSTDIYTDLDTIYLTEIYSLTLEKPLKHLQEHRLIHAWWLSVLGLNDEADQYCESIANIIKEDQSILDQLKTLGDVTSTDQDTIQILGKDVFDSLISKIERKISGPAEQETSYGYGGGYGAPGYGAPGYDAPGYGYGDQFTTTTTVNEPIPEDESLSVNTPLKNPQVAAIQSPFQYGSSGGATPIQSPFQNSARSVTSPFQHGGASPGYTPQIIDGSGDTNNGGWWGGNDAEEENAVDLQQQQSYTPYHPETSSYEPSTASFEPTATTTAPSYEPTSYQPAPAATNAFDDDDGLGLGNSSLKPKNVDNDDDEAKKKQEEEEKKKQEEEKKKKDEKKGGGWGLFTLFGRNNNVNADDKKAVKANLGEQSQFYYDEVEKRWVNKLNDSKPAAATPPPPPRTPSAGPSMQTPPPSSSMGASPLAGTPPMAGTPPLPPFSTASSASIASGVPPRVNSAPNPAALAAGGPPSAAPPSFNTPPTSRRKGPGGKKSMRSRYVDVLNQS